MLTLALGMSLAAAGAFAAFADPLGLSYINGQTVTSRMGGFEFSAPAEYKVDRSGASSALSGEIVAGLVEDSGKIDFAASMVDETNKSYIINTAMVLPADDGSGQPFSVETLKAELAESGLDPADTESGTVKLGAADYEYLKVNYGKMMADSIRRQLEGSLKSRKHRHRPLSTRWKRCWSMIFISGIQETKSMYSARPIPQIRRSGLLHFWVF